MQLYQCGTCHQVVCLDCDLYIRETLHTCPGCASDSKTAQMNSENLCALWTVRFPQVMTTCRCSHSKLVSTVVTEMNEMKIAQMADRGTYRFHSSGLPLSASDDRNHENSSELIVLNTCYCQRCRCANKYNMLVSSKSMNRLDWFSSYGTKDTDNDVIHMYILKLVSSPVSEWNKRPRRCEHLHW